MIILKYFHTKCGDTCFLASSIYQSLVEQAQTTLHDYKHV